MEKRYAGYDYYNCFINAKECHSATVNLLLPTRVYIKTLFQFSAVYVIVNPKKEIRSKKLMLLKLLLFLIS